MKKYEPDDSWHKTKADAWAAWEAAQKPAEPAKEVPAEERQAAFVAGMKQGMAPKEAAVSAGYSAKAAAMTAGRLLNKPEVLEAISK